MPSVLYAALDPTLVGPGDDAVLPDGWERASERIRSAALAAEALAPDDPVGLEWDRPAAQVQAVAANLRAGGRTWDAVHAADAVTWYRLQSLLGLPSVLAAYEPRPDDAAGADAAYLRSFVSQARARIPAAGAQPVDAGLLPALPYRDVVAQLVQLALLIEGGRQEEAAVVAAARPITAAERAAAVAFLDALDDPALLALVDVRPRPPADAPVLTRTTIEQLRAYEFEQRVSAAVGATRQRLVPRDDPPERLHLTYVMARVDVGGGSRIILEHANRLHHAGCQVTIVTHWPRPDWHDVACAYRQVPFATELADGIPPCDVVIATYWDHVYACVSAGVAPVLYFEQGDFHLYEHVEPQMTAAIRRQIASAAGVFTLSRAAAIPLRDRYGVDAPIIPNAVERSLFRPASGPAGRARGYLLMIGSDEVAFKGTATVRAAYEALAAEGRELDLVWVTPRELAAPLGEVHVRPSQTQLAELFRHAAVFVSGSTYETFPLPPLEAMASGCPVVSTANQGVLEYARDAENCLLAPIGDVAAVTDAVRRVLDDAELRATIVAGGLATAAGYDWDVIIARLVDHYRQAAGRRPEPADVDAEWEIDLAGGQFAEPDGDQRFRALLAATPHDAVSVPAAAVLVEGHVTARWVPVAQRRRPRGTGLRRFFAPIAGVQPDLPYAAALDALLAGRAAAALDGFEQAFDSAEPADQAVLVRWMVLCLIELDRDDDAAQLAANALKLFDDCADLYYLWAMATQLAGKPGAAAALDAIDVLQDSCGYPEFFLDVAQLARARIARG